METVANIASVVVLVVFALMSLTGLWKGKEPNE
jgi:hypothetical protein